MTTRRTFVTTTALAAGLGTAPVLWAQAPKPMLAGMTSRGERVSLQSLQGSVVLVFIWSTRCPVCLDKLPELRRNLDGWQGKPFVILALNQDRNIDDMRGYERLLEQTGPSRSQMKHLWRRAADHRDSFGELADNAPTTLIFDKQVALSKQLRGRVPAELWDDIAELVLG
jgi:thiol-disulfide isomerase/thioredoxin